MKDELRIGSIGQVRSGARARCELVAARCVLEAFPDAGVAQRTNGNVLAQQVGGDLGTVNAAALGADGLEAELLRVVGFLHGVGASDGFHDEDFVRLTLAVVIRRRPVGIASEMDSGASRGEWRAAGVFVQFSVANQFQLVDLDKRTSNGIRCSLAGHCAVSWVHSATPFTVPLTAISRGWPTAFLVFSHSIATLNHS